MLLEKKMVAEKRFDYIWNITLPRFRSKRLNIRNVDLPEKPEYLKLLPKNGNVLISSDKNEFTITNGFSSNCGKNMCIVSAVMFRVEFDQRLCDMSGQAKPGVYFIHMFDKGYLEYDVFGIDT
ncbi:hypothetical protein M5M_11710 [Simiduia agarivorans SA1 = DSM 21679]|uniref:Uncharacterized protein n=1 Tax=Simiduia agarivorans (strain DSM 21679 / JCM 13881 / BCRC 17597 / SA1) TaxID=1117647 RepID=K4KK34_SIMAS|nr:hypothetical protein M5M_11710 [Simiduia agarivorans SA1 = DSM 21679]